MKFDPFVWEFNSWIVGTKAFLDAISHAASEAASIEAADKLQRRAESEGWEGDDFFVEYDILRENFEYWLPRLSAYAVIILLHSLVETQLHACARRLRRDRSLDLEMLRIFRGLAY
ncbi:MAG: hypothetical protein DMF87_24750 [Acidobacteria bacterium]|nr:MAG: hypothetical protein DMF87_24750 [Acidobacteriota bacterium]